MSQWVLRAADDAGGGTDVEDLDGMPWNAARRPARWHACYTRTYGRVLGALVRRCACGAIAIGYPRGGIAGGLVWCERNSRPRRGRRRAPGIPAAALRSILGGPATHEVGPSPAKAAR